MSENFYKSFSLWLVRILVFAVPFIPLVVATSMFFPYITGKAFIFRAIVEITFAAWVFLAFFYREYRPRKNILLVALVVFIGVVTLATIFGVNPARSFWSNFERMEGLITYLHLAAYFLVLAHVFERRDWIMLFNLFVISGFVENTFVLFQKLGFIASPQGGVRVDGTIGNSTYLAAYLIFVLGFAAILWIHAKTKAGKIYYGAASVWSLLSIYFTATRGAMLALLVVGFVFSIIYLVLVKTNTPAGKRHRKVGLYVLLSLAAIPVLFYFVKDTNFVQTSPVLGRFRNLSIDTARYYIWGMAFEGFKEHPVLGWGPDNFGIVFSKYYRPELYSQEPWFDRAHNIVLDWLANAGLLGLLSYLGLFGSAGYLLWKNYRSNKLALEVAVSLSMLLAVYFVQNLFVFDNIATYLSFFTILAYIYNMAVFEDPLETAQAGARVSRHATYRPAVDLAYAPMVWVVIALPFLWGFYTVNVKPFMTNLALLNALKVNTVDDLQGAFGEFKRALSYDTFANPEIREQISRFADAIGGSSSVPDSFKLEVFKLALDEADKGVKENPLDSRPYLFLSALLSRANLLDQALSVLQKALELSPKKQQIFFEIADIYIKKGDYKKASEILKTTWELAPEYSQARLNLIATLVLAGDNVAADEQIRQAYPGGVGPERILVQVYQKVGDYRRLLPILLAFVNQSPDNWDARRDVADDLIKLGRRAEAVSYIETAVKDRPQFKVDAEAYLRQIR